MLSWCERQGVGYIVGLAKNARLNDLAAPWMETAAQGFAGTGFKQRLFGEFAYAAGTWNAERRVIARIEHGPKGANPRYIVTNLEGDAQDLYATGSAGWSKYRVAARSLHCRRLGRRTRSRHP